jgi:hypothetical protein
MSQIAGLILQFDKVMPTQSRFAYASLLLVPGLEQLTFNPLLRQIKRTWNVSQARYSSFYDASSIVQKLASAPLNWTSLEQFRKQL